MIHLNLTEIRVLDTAIQTWYNQWVEQAPAAYKLDQFLTHRIPVAITSIYGQNQPLLITENHDAEDAANWERSRDFSRLRYISFSLASHFVYVYLVYCSAPCNLYVPQGGRG
jgi:hypothetical protein